MDKSPLIGKPWLLNLPFELMFSDECQNLISCMQAYQPSAGLKCPSKDFVDNARYFAIGNFEYIDEDELMPTGGGSY